MIPRKKISRKFSSKVLLHVSSDHSPHAIHTTSNLVLFISHIDTASPARNPPAVLAAPGHNIPRPGAGNASDLKEFDEFKEKVRDYLVRVRNKTQDLYHKHTETDVGNTAGKITFAFLPPILCRPQSKHIYKYMAYVISLCRFQTLMRTRRLVPAAAVPEVGLAAKPEADL